jgi:hypothetical protein
VRTTVHLLPVLPLIEEVIHCSGFAEPATLEMCGHRSLVSVSSRRQTIDETNALAAFATVDLRRLSGDRRVLLSSLYCVEKQGFIRFQTIRQKIAYTLRILA